MPLWPNFCGGSYRTRSLNIAAATAENIYLETSKSNESAKQGNFYGTPGLSTILNMDSSECRGSFNQDGRTFTVFGAVLYEIDFSGGPPVASWAGSVRDDGKPVSFASNGIEGFGGGQLCIVSAGVVYILDLVSGGCTTPALPFTGPAVQVVFLGGYFLVNEFETVKIWFSGFYDGTSWDGLDFFVRQQTSDYIVGIAVLHARLLVLGSQTGETYYLTTDADNPFQVYPGSLIQEGLSSPRALTVLGENALWLAQDNQGRKRMVAGSDSSAPQRISTPAIEFEIASYVDIGDCEVLAYEQEGHSFAIWTFPTGDASWAYDLAEQEWHRRGEWNQALGVFSRWRARGICSTDSGLMVGDFATNELYFLDLNTFTDGDRLIRRARRAPYLSGENQWMFLDQIELGLESGVGLATGQGSDPEVMLYLSRDGGHTFDNCGEATIGPMGEWETRAIWAALGRVRSDRLVIEISQSDPVKTVWGPGLWLRASPGTGML